MSAKEQIEQNKKILLTMVHRTINRQDDRFTLLEKIMSRQSQWEEKLDNIISFRITRRRKYKSLLLQLKVKNCNRWLTVSWRKGITKEIKEINPLYSAMRNSIRRQITMWRKKHMNELYCAECGSKTFLQVDHKFPSFYTIRNDFLAKEIKPTIFDHCSFGFKFKKLDSAFKKRWQQFHKSNATYQWLCKSCNCKKGK